MTFDSDDHDESHKPKTDPARANQYITVFIIPQHSEGILYHESLKTRCLRCDITIRWDYLFLERMKQHNYYVYIVTNASRSVLYTGVTNDIARRLYEHFENKGNPQTFAGKYYCYNLIYYERFQFVQHAIDREKEIKDWSRAKKETLINSENPDWRFLNEEIY